MGCRLALAFLVAAAWACGGGNKAAPDASTCGNGVVDPGEDCDGGANCTATCTFACSNPAVDCPAAPVCQMAACDANHACADVADTSQDGTSCGTNMKCQNGSCLSTMAVCGDGTVEFGEDCDFGSNNGPGTGCESNCKFSCTMSPNSCDDGNVCNGLETCITNTVGGATGQICMSAANAMNGTACGTGMICTNGSCTADVCGNGYAVAPEECDDGGLNGTPGDGCSATCTYTCVSTDPSRDCASNNPCIGQGTCNDTTHVCTAGSALTNGTPCGSGGTCQNGVCTSPICGDGVRSGTEQCDDGNTKNLDGCDSGCRFEQVHRMITVTIPRTTDTFCPSNAIGTALNATAKSQIDSSLASGVKDGSITVILDMLGLDDLTGQNDASLTVGNLTGVQQTGTTTYNGQSDLDWWYTTDTSTIDANRVAITQMPASFTSGALAAGPTEVTYKLNFAGVAVSMDLVGSKIKATVGSSNKPTTSSGGTPGHLASENLDPNLTSFSTMSAGELCGKTTAQSLANTHVPSVLTSGFGKCDANYTTANSLLDLYISGCHNVLAGQLVTATQPDGSRDGATYRFTADASHTVTSCTRNGAADTLSDCLTNATYSTWVNFTTDRVIAK